MADIGSDHYGILFTLESLSSFQPRSQCQPRLNINQAEWGKFATILQEITKNNTVLLALDDISPLSDTDGIEYLRTDSHFTIDQLDQAASELTSCISEAARACMPPRSFYHTAKPWWNKNLKVMRKDMTRRHKIFKCNKDDLLAKISYLEARNNYFSAIKVAKQGHWNKFLEKEDAKSIFKAMSYTKDRQKSSVPSIRSADNQLEESFEGKCKAFRNALFPPPPHADQVEWNNYQPGRWTWPILEWSELERACSTNIKGTTPGPDGISHQIIIQAYQAIPHIFFQLYSSLFKLGYHPQCWKQATVIIL